jgi:hypothetical protein
VFGFINIRLTVKAKKGEQRAKKKACPVFMIREDKIGQKYACPDKLKRYIPVLDSVDEKKG